MKRKMTTGEKLVIVLLLLVLIASIVVGLYAWAKYTSQESDNATAVIAKWNFDLKLKNGAKNGSATETAGPINLADTISYSHVKSGTIAPGTSGQFQVIVDTTGTEVDTKYDVTISLTNCPRNITFTRVDESETATVLSAGGASNELTRTLTFSKYLHAKPTNQNGKHYETILWDWPYELTTGEDSAKIAWDNRDKEDMGLQVGMTITAKATEMMSDPNAQSALPANSVQALAQNNQIQVWDSINYNPGTGTTASLNLPAGASIQGSKLASLNLPAGASLDDTISASSAQDWVVLDVNQTTGEVLIIPRTYSGTTLTLSGKDGYNNAIQALDMVAGIYLNPTYANSARSIRIEDIDKIENHTPDGGNVATETWNHRYGVNLATLDITDTESDLDTPEQTYSSTATTAYYVYGTEYFAGSSFWLASRCLGIGSGYCGFNVRIIDDGCVNSYVLFGAFSGGNTNASDVSCPVLPVVSLKSTVQLEQNGAYTGLGIADVASGNAVATEHTVWEIQ